MESSVFQPIVQAWLSAIKSAESDAAPWRGVVDDCRLYYFSFGPIADSDEKIRKLFGKAAAETKPRFNIHIAKSFESVAIYGPALFWAVPERDVVPKKYFEIPPEIVAESPSQELAMLLTMAQQQMASMMPERRLRAALMKEVLNYWPTACGLEAQSRQAVIDAILTGRGILLPQINATDSGLEIGSYHVPSIDFLVDPMATSLWDAGWVAIRTREPRWVVAQRWGLDPEELMPQKEPPKSFADLAWRKLESKNGYDQITYYRIFSRIGIGQRLRGFPQESAELFEGTGDYVYLEVAEGVEYPLNMAHGEYRPAYLQWPIPPVPPYPWPMAILEFYQMPGYPYPIPLIAPAIAELKALDLFFGHILSKLWKQTRDYLAVPVDAADQVRQALREQQDDDDVILPVEVNQRAVSDVLQFLTRPSMASDQWQLLQMLNSLFERRTGLTEILYGATSKQTRSATEAAMKQQYSGLRIEYLTSVTEQWQIACAKLEAALTRRNLDAGSAMRILGPVGGHLWERLVLAQPESAVTDDLEYRIAAVNARRLNRFTELEYLQQFSQIFAPVLTQIAQQTGNTQPLNQILKRWANLVGFDVTGLEYPQSQQQQPQQQPQPQQPQPQPQPPQAMMPQPAG